MGPGCATGAQQLPGEPSQHQPEEIQSVMQQLSELPARHDTSGDDAQPCSLEHIIA